jgi:hypothetical protein
MVSMPWMILTASWHWTPAMMELMVGVVGVLPRSGDALDLFDGAVDPGAVDFPGGAVDGEARFAVVESADDDVGPAEDADAEIVNDVAVKEGDVHLGVNFFCRARGDGGFEIAGVGFAVEHRAGEVGVFDAIFVGDEEVADAEEGEVFDDLVAEGAGADEEDFGGGEFLLIPPGDEAEAVEAVVLLVA